MNQTKPPSSRPFGLQRRHYIAVRVVLLVGILVVGVTLHHRGVAYDVIRGVYLALILSLLVWRLNRRRTRQTRVGADDV